MKLPPGWKRQALVDVADFYDHKRVPLEKAQREVFSGQYPYYGASGVIDHVAKFIFEGDFVLLAEDGANILNRSTPVAFRARGQFWVNNHAHVMQPKKGVDHAFLVEYLESLNFERFNTGTTQPKLNRHVCEQIPVIVPPQAEQKKLGEFAVAWDTAIQKTEQLIAAKERHYSHELSRLISRGQHPHAHVGSFAEEVSARSRGGVWRTVALSDIATIWKGQQLNKDAMVEDGAYYALNGGIKPSGRTTEWNCEAGTITVSSGGNSCGFIRFNKERFWCGGDCFALKNLSADTDVAYLFNYLKGQQHRMTALRTGSGIPHVYRADIEVFPVVLPDLATQTAIARYLNALREEIDLLGQSVAALKTQKRGLMQKLLTGRWRVPLRQANEKETTPC